MGFVSSSGNSKTIFENDFLKNLCFTFHWQPPSSYTIQKKIVEFSQSIRKKIYETFRSKSSATLIVYPWSDLSKRATLSFLLIAPTGLISYLKTIPVSQEMWSVQYIFQQTQEIIQDLRDLGIRITMVYYDDISTFNAFKKFLQNDTHSRSLPCMGNLTHWSKDLLSVLFSHESLQEIKQFVCFSICMFIW